VKAHALGIDGCRAGWLYVRQDVAEGTLSAGVLRHIEEILAFPAAGTIVCIDMPIGLADAGSRACEKAARRLLGRPRASSVFPVPARAVLRAATYRQACRIGKQADGRKVNRQTWNIVPKIREVDAFLASHAAYRACIHEAHPELSFLRWNAGEPMKHSKKTAEGRAERERLVTAVFGAEYRSARDGLPRAGWAADDFLDAFAALWTALRVMRHEALSVPEEPETDSRGLRMQIVS
jgi:predicted RNase H-like nuclease